MRKKKKRRNLKNNAHLAFQLVRHIHTYSSFIDAVCVFAFVIGNISNQIHPSEDKKEEIQAQTWIKRQRERQTDIDRQNQRDRELRHAHTCNSPPQVDPPACAPVATRLPECPPAGSGPETSPLWRPVGQNVCLFLKWTWPKKNDTNKKNCEHVSRWLSDCKYEAK